MKFNYLILSVWVIISGCNDSDPNNDIEIYISSGELQCQENGLSIAKTKSYLLDAGIDVKAEICGFLTHIDYPTVCAGGTGKLHVFTIDKSDSQVAENLGFTIPNSSLFKMIM
jgi:hypothetical protein